MSTDLGRWRNSSAREADRIALAAMAVDAVLPLRLADLERFARLLHPSLERYGAELVARCHVVVPDHEYAEALRRCPAGPYEVLRETEVVPVLRTQRVDARYRQQLVKLGIVDWISTPYYLTLDADVLFTRACTFGALARDGRAWFCRRLNGKHREWARLSERALGLRWSGASYAVTPSILSTNGVRRLLAHASPSAPSADGSDSPRIAGTRALAARLPWTEYTLYGIFMESEGLLQRHHWVRPDKLYCNSIWYPEDFAAWDPDLSFGEDATGFFTVIQSWTGIDVAEVLERIGPYLA